jgi:hypothetical protein
MGHIHIHYSRPGSRSEGAVPFFRQIAHTDEPSQLAYMRRKVSELHSIGPVNALLLTARSHATAIGPGSSM